MTRGSLVALSSLLAFSTGACKRGAESIAVLAANPVPVFEGTTPLPKIVVNDSSGTPMNPTPPLEIKAEPASVLWVDGSNLRAMDNGDATLHIQVKGTDVKLTHPVRVRITDVIQITCDKPDCSYRVGDPVKLTATVQSRGAAVPEAPVAWTMPAIIAETAPGKLEAKTPGRAMVVVVSGSSRAEAPIYVSATPDKLEVACAPERLVEQDDKRICRLREGAKMVIEPKVLGAGVPVHGAKVRWSSSNAEVATVDAERGEVVGVGAGAATITGAIDNLTASFDVAVTETCKGKFRGVDLEVVLEDASGQKIQASARYWCQHQNPKICLTASRKVGKPSPEVVESCCCRETDPSAEPAIE